MQVIQIYNLINDLYANFGGKSQNVLDLNGLIALGDTVLSSSTNKEQFLQTLADRISKTIITDKKYKSKTFGLLVDKITWGACIQKISYEMPSAETNNEYTSYSNGDTINNITMHKPTVYQKLFSSKNTWEYEIDVLNSQLETAFTSETAFVSFVSGIYTTIENRIQLDIENLTKATIVNLIGEKLAHAITTSADKDKCYINLLDEYNTKVSPSTTLTKAKALYDENFLIFASQTMAQIKKFMKDFSVNFNTDDRMKFTDDSDMICLVQSDFASAIQYNLRSNIYHEDLVKLPEYHEINSWQLNLDGVRQKVALEVSSGDSVECEDVVAVLFDRNACGVMFDRDEVETEYIKNCKSTHSWYRGTKGMFNDLSEQSIVFTLSDAATPTS